MARKAKDCSATNRSAQNNPQNRTTAKKAANGTQNKAANTTQNKTAGSQNKQ